LAIVSVKELLEAGVHYGHHTSRWNPKMRSYIYGKRNSIHIVNLVATCRGLLRATKFVRRLCSRGESVLIVGTKRQAQAVIQAEGTRGEVSWVTERWLGGTLTNFQTIRSRLNRLLELEELEESGRIAAYSKKEASMLMREKRKIHRNLDGLRKMDKHPGVIIVIDPRREKNVIFEANKLNIPVIALLDTDSDPDRISIPIPGNDDAIKSIQLITSQLIDAILEGREIHRGRIEKMEQEAAERAEKAAADKVARAEAAEKAREAKAAAAQAQAAAATATAVAEPEAKVADKPTPEAPAEG
jgi:small subunit ribosomal protein S2